MKRTLISFLLIYFLSHLSVSAAPAPYPITINSRAARAPDVVTFTGNECVFRATFQDGNTASDITGLTPFMNWATSSEASTFVESSASIIVATNGTCDFTFAPSNLAYTAGSYIYEIGVKTAGGVASTYRQGSFLLVGSPTGSGTNIAGTTNINWSLYEYSNTASDGPYRAGTNITFSANSDGSVNIDAGSLSDTTFTNTITAGSLITITGGATSGSNTISQTADAHDARYYTEAEIDGFEFHNAGSLTGTLAQAVSLTIDQLGTVTTGVWNATIIDDAYLSTDLYLKDGSRAMTGNQNGGGNYSTNWTLLGAAFVYAPNGTQTWDVVGGIFKDPVSGAHSVNIRERWLLDHSANVAIDWDAGILNFNDWNYSGYAITNAKLHGLELQMPTGAKVNYIATAAVSNDTSLCTSGEIDRRIAAGGGGGTGVTSTTVGTLPIVVATNGTEYTVSYDGTQTHNESGATNIPYAGLSFTDWTGTFDSLEGAEVFLHDGTRAMSGNGNAGGNSWTNLNELQTTGNIRVAATKKVVFDADEDTYIYSDADDLIRVVSGGVMAGYFNASQEFYVSPGGLIKHSFVAGSAFSSSGYKLRTDPNTTSAPLISDVADDNTGLSMAGDIIYLIAGGTRIGTFGSTGLDITGKLEGNSIKLSIGASPTNIATTLQNDDTSLATGAAIKTYGDANWQNAAGSSIDSRAATNNVDMGQNQIYGAGALLTSATNVTINWDTGNMPEIVLGTNVTFAFSNVRTNATYMLRLEQDGTGSRTVTWPATVHWHEGTAPTLSTATGRWDIINFAVWGDTNEISARAGIYWGP